ncbi:BREX-1 system adenine-specific DNA-methyltransferase PglX [Virgibacillus litoralis]|uniref:site-specific DNA-methyltransferase (adenine-specific) n=1 Tax=Virgibacillus litoralis TaxID=578221 RepID=A0ABS4HIX8_9BACI|nr:BREX-1 system adenine-specific DNA-methyltransferase PglX [Virgibacillus litoralis]MBP1950689.1 type II restriction/modification system DNA methylase subunit YeeA [Virgibacillus litoralis]
MNKVELKKFAVEARRDLIDKVSLKTEQYGITKDNQEINIEENYGQLIVNGKTFPIEMKHAVHTLQQSLNRVGYDQLVEEVAYTWFNRIIAIRYMEVNNYLPDRVNVLSSSTGKNEPDILLQYETMNLDVDHQQINKWLQKNDNEKAYRKLFVAQCNNLNTVFPTLFEKINDYTELLLPDYLLDSEFIISKLVVNQELVDSFKEVEVIGWLYQYYNAEPKDKVFAKLRQNKKAEKNEIPAATQFFTPKWIVQYLVENSLGQLWLEAYPNSEIKKSLDYYIEPAEQTDEVKRRFEETRYKSINLEEITLIDPCVGSGHILVYTFDLLYQMYEEAGYLSKDIPKLILENNLFGIDIDERATQMASFALMMKAREKSRRILKQNINLNIIAIEESNNLGLQGLVNLLANNKQEEKEIELIINLYQNAKNFGSMLKPPKVDYNKYLDRIDSIGEVQISVETTRAYEQLESFKYILTQSIILVSQYNVAITNPPYMGNKGMNKTLKNFLKNYYDKSKSDLYTVFIERIQDLTKEYGINSSVTQHSWMFLSSFEGIRKYLLNNNTILNLVHLGTRAFEDIGGEVVQTSAQTLRKVAEPNYNSTFVRLVHYNNSKSKEENFSNDSNKFYALQNSFSNIPSSPISYWASAQVKKIFREFDGIGEIAKPRQGMATSDNDRFLRNWYEVNNMRIGIGFGSNADAEKSNYKWFPYNKGGSYRKWYGNYEKVINWENGGQEVKELATSLYNNATRTIKNIPFYFREGITWSFVSSAYFGVRYTPKGFIFDVGGSSLFPDEDINVYLSYLASKVSPYFISFINPTLNFQVGNVANLPLPVMSEELKSKVVEITQENVDISRLEWDSFETSWDFKSHPFISYTIDNTLSDAYGNWNQETTNRFNNLKNNEQELNEIFINFFGLYEELSSEVADNEITIVKADRVRETKSFLSFYIGCVLGRYSLDQEGLNFAGGEFDESKYESFKPNQDGLIHLTDDHYFDNDIVVRLREFLSVGFSPQTVDENMQWLAESLTMKKNESPEERLRRYFLDEFFKDHCKMYQKRPIYWLVDSGKQKGLRTLIYMHRYQPDTMASIRFEHLQEIQSKYQNEISMIDTRLANPSLSATDRRSLDKAKTDYQKKIDELQEFDKHLATYANEQIDIDLDDGVKVNYAEFDKVLSKIK